MKRFYLLLLLLATLGTLSAQEVTVERQYGENYTTITRIIPRKVNKHDFRFAVGTYMSGNRQYLHADCWGGSCAPDFREQIAYTDTYLTDRRHWGAYSLSYVYHFRRWFQFGGTVSYGFATQSRRDLQTDEVVVNMNRHAVGVMPTFRFIYMYREKVQLYSAISGGLVFGTGISLPWLDATLIGCSFGKNIFGFAEIGAGVCGWGRVGIGYRFDAKKK
jgi:hypothetical protein